MGDVTVTGCSAVPRCRPLPQLGGTAQSCQEQEGEKPRHGTARGQCGENGPSTGRGKRGHRDPKRRRVPEGQAVHVAPGTIRTLPATHLSAAPPARTQQPLAGSPAQLPRL